MSRRRWTIAVALGAQAILACSHAQSSGPTDTTEKPPAADADAAVLHLDPLADAGADTTPANYNGPYLYAIFMQTPVMSDMEWPIPEGSKIRDPAREAVKRIGYLRRGARVPVIAEAHRQANCLDGWYELLSGGFVCGKYATLDANHPRVRLAPHPPYTDQALPYDYGYNLTNGTPLYRTLPSRKDRVEFEPWLSGRARPKRGIETDNPYGDLDAGAAPLNDPYASTSSSSDDLDAGATPWYLRDWDGGKPQVTLDDLNEDSQGPILRRMVRGFYLALDKTENDPRDKHKPESMQTKWWKTTSGFFAPFDRIVVNKNVSDFHGVWLDEPPIAGAPTTIGNPPRGDAGAEPITPYATTYPIGFILWNGHQYILSEDGKRLARGAAVDRFTAVGLTGKTMESGGHLFYETQNGWWMRMADGRITRPLPPPKDLKPGEKWVDVNLTQQSLVAFEGEKPVFATVISSGKKDKDNPEKNHETKPGIFRIREKHIAATMDGDVASDGPYSIEDVPWIMYFNGSIALHGAFWHTAFGSMKSHGCVNMAPLDARAMFHWTDPQLPEGWHGVWATPEHPGTRVIVHDEEEDKKNGCTPQNPGCKR